MNTVLDAKGFARATQSAIPGALIVALFELWGARVRRKMSAHARTKTGGRFVFRLLRPIFYVPIALALLAYTGFGWQALWERTRWVMTAGKRKI